jgi:hypothetical protein
MTAGNLTQDEQHNETAKSHLFDQYKNSHAIKSIITSIVEPLQKLENKLFEIYQNADLREAKGHYLDRIGAIVGEDRNYLRDDEYRFSIRVRIIANNGGATPDEIIIILRSLYGEQIRYSESYNAYFQIHITCEDKPYGINALLHKLKPAAVGTPSVIFLESEDVFRFSEVAHNDDNFKLSTEDGLENEGVGGKNNLIVSFGTLKIPDNTQGFAEIIVDRYSLNLHDDNKYLINKRKELEMVRNYKDYTIEGGSVFAELIQND